MISEGLRILSWQQQCCVLNLVDIPADTGVHSRAIHQGAAVNPEDDALELSIAGPPESPWHVGMRCLRKEGAEKDHMSSDLKMPF